MAQSQGIRRFLRFSLRSLMLVTLAVAAWLGVEVHYARTVEPQTEAIRALGGEVDFEPSPWSLARFIEPRRFGRRIVAAQVPGDGAAELLPMLEAMPHLRELRVAYDGSYDVMPSWSTVCSRLTQPRLLAVALPVVDAYDTEPDITIEEADKRWDHSVSKKRYERFAAKVAEGTNSDKEASWEMRPSAVAPEQYQVLCLPDGRLAEVLLNQCHGFLYGEEFAIATVLVDDRYVQHRFLPAHTIINLRDIDADGRVEVAVEPSSETPRWHRRLPTHIVNGTPFLKLYAIEATGLRSLLPDE